MVYLIVIADVLRGGGHGSADALLSPECGDRRAVLAGKFRQLLPEWPKLTLGTN